MTTLPLQMTAIAIRAPGGPEVLIPEQRPVPTPGTGEILGDIVSPIIDLDEFEAYRD